MPVALAIPVPRRPLPRMLAGVAAWPDGRRSQYSRRAFHSASRMVAPIFEIFSGARRGIHAGRGRSSKFCPSRWRLTGNLAYFLVLVGYFIVHFFEHTLAPHFHFGEETHVEHFVPDHAGISALLGLSIHTFFDGVAIASGFLVSGLARRRDFSGHFSAQNSGGFYGRFADAGQRAEPPHGVSGRDLAGRGYRGGSSADGLAAFARSATRCRFRRESRCMSPRPI